MNRENFEKLVEEALAELPGEFKKLIDNLAVFIEDEAPPEVYRQTRTHPFSRILGTYHGVPYTQRGPFYGNILPDRIIIYQNPIEEICRTEEDMKKRVRSVVIHEVGHYFGLSDLDMEKIEREIRQERKKEKKRWPRN
jgi:predicted Zn-dependent protease with MMP-like domain